MRRSGNKEENKRIIMDLEVVLKSHDSPYIVQCVGVFVTDVSEYLQITVVPFPFYTNNFCTLNKQVICQVKNDKIGKKEF